VYRRKTTRTARIDAAAAVGAKAVIPAPVNSAVTDRATPRSGAAVRRRITERIYPIWTYLRPPPPPVCTL
jgi:hypothetical protein